LSFYTAWADCRPVVASVIDPKRTSRQSPAEVLRQPPTRQSAYLGGSRR
jgi:hypothetical protein